MNRKVLIVSVLAVAGLMIFALSAITVYALVRIGTSQTEAITGHDSLRVAPVQAEVEPASAPVMQYEKTSYDEGGGCPYSKMMMTHAPAEKTVEDQPLAQASQ
jgi:hypothetical protein